MTRVDIPKLIELLYHHPNNGFVFDVLADSTTTFSLSREELEELIKKAEIPARRPSLE